MNETVWVLGGHGVVGEALKAASVAKNFRFPKRNEFEIGTRENLQIKNNDIVIDLVPEPQPRKYPGLSAVEYHKNFTGPHLAFIRKIIKQGIKKYIYVSSGGSIYGRTDQRIPIKEEHPLSPVSHYGEAKRRVEEVVKNESISMNSPYVILRPGNVFNSNPRSPKQTGLIGIFKTKFEKNEPLDIFGPPSIAKDYVSNEDVAQAIILALETQSSGVFNIGSGVRYSIAEILKTFAKTFKMDLPQNHHPMLANDVDWFCLDIQKAKNTLHYRPQINLLTWIETNTNRPS